MALWLACCCPKTFSSQCLVQLMSAVCLVLPQQRLQYHKSGNAAARNASYHLTRPPLDSITPSTRLSKLLQSPSTSRFALTSSTTPFKRSSYCMGVSNQHWLGVVVVSLCRIQPTAVSCNRISCICPGCTAAQLPIKFLRSWSAGAWRNLVVMFPVPML